MGKEKRVNFKIVLLLAAIVALLAGCVILGIQVGNHYAAKARAAVEPVYRTFADWTERETLQDVPALVTDHTRIEDIGDCGEGTFGIVVDGSNLSDYWNYLAVLEEAGFAKYVDNGKDGLDKAIYSASFTKDDLTVTVTLATKDKKIYVMSSRDLPLSKHLIYDASNIANNESGRKTRLHMLEMFDCGNSFIFELKNGHFIINDGGDHADLGYLLDYLESLTPAGERPVIEAWIFSHEHVDHNGAFLEFMNRPEEISRLVVNGIYWNPPNYEIFGLYDANAYASLSVTKLIASMMRTTEGTAPQIYRMQSGQRYYFDDITVDVLHTQEQLRKENYYNNLNDSSIWLMYTVDSQKILLCGDADRGSTNVVMRTFDSDYFDLEAFVVFHHGINLWYDFTDYLKHYEISIWPNYRAASKDGSARYTEFSKYITDRAKESFGHGKGTVVWEFPYELGTATFMEPVDWTEYVSKPRKGENGEHTGIWYWVDETDFDVYIKNYD